MPIIDITSYKNEIMKDLFTSERIVKGINSQQVTIDEDPIKGYDVNCPDTLIYNNIFPYISIKEVQRRADSYIMFGVDITGINKHNPTYANYRIKFRIFVHDDHMQMEGYSGTRLDYLYEEVKRIFDGEHKYGFGELELSSRMENLYNEKYHYVDMTFYTADLRKPADERR